MAERQLDAWDGTRLRQLRRSRGLSAAELGRQIGRTGALISQIEAGTKWPGWETAAALAEALGVTQADIGATRTTDPVSGPPAAT